MVPKVIYHPSVTTEPSEQGQKLDEAFGILFQEVSKRLRETQVLIPKWRWIIGNMALTPIDNNEYD